MRGKNTSPEGGEAFFEERVFYSERGDASPLSAVRHFFGSFIGLNMFLGYNFTHDR